MGIFWIVSNAGEIGIVSRRQPLDRRRYSYYTKQRTALEVSVERLIRRMKNKRNKRLTRAASRV